ncbi:MAG: phosphatidylserine decarboxylase, partial [Gammaproteobacteria bacterium]|nr:phosphatidylserine decarboxylase [Gammaproteobacteria bacterium]
DNLFARNERVVFHLQSPQGAVALVMVGAMNVGSIETLHQGVIAPGGNKPRSWSYDPAMEFERNQQLGWFNLGSTVILLFADGVARLEPTLASGQTLQVGEAIARL